MTSDIWPRNGVASDPAFSTIITEPSQENGFHYQILDSSGRELMNGELLQKNRFSLEISTLEPGLYFIRAETRHQSQTEKFIIQ